LKKTRQTRFRVAITTRVGRRKSIVARDYWLVELLRDKTL